MKRSRFSEEQMVAILKEQEGGMATADVCRRKRSVRQHCTSRSRSTTDWRCPRHGACGRSRRRTPSLRSSWPRRCGDARQRHTEGSGLKKMVMPGAERDAGVQGLPQMGLQKTLNPILGALSYSVCKDAPA